MCFALTEIKDFRSQNVETAFAVIMVWKIKRWTEQSARRFFIKEKVMNFKDIEVFDLQDCPYCQGPAWLEHVGGWCCYGRLLCPDDWFCGYQL